MNQIDIFGTVTDEMAQQVLAQIQYAANGPLLVRINSEGGSVQAGTMIYTALRSHTGPVTVEITGWALSVASMIAMAGRPIRMGPTSIMMIHAPWVSASGNAQELRQTAVTLETVAQSMVSAYKRSKQRESTINTWLAGGEYWFTAEEAIALGLADELIPAAQAQPVNAMACASFTIPARIQEHIKMQATAQEQQAQAAARLADLERREAIRAEFRHFAHYPGMNGLMESLVNDPKANKDTAAQAILAALAKDVQPVGAVHVQVTENTYTTGFHGTDSDRREFMAAATDALLMRAGMPAKNPHPAAKDLRGMSIAGMAERLLSMRGQRVVGRTSAELIQAAMTTDDLPLLLQGVTERALRESYETAPASHTIWTAQREVSDFRPQTLLQMSEAPNLEKVGEHGEFTNGSLSEAAESFRVETFGRIISVSRQSLVNDDLGAITRLPAAFAAAARRLEADLVYGKLTSNPTMADNKALFHTAHGNIGTPAALSVESLAEARSMMRRQKTLGGKGFLDIAPRYLIVPTVLETHAETLLASLARPDSANAGVANPAWIRSLELVTDPRLDAVSTTAWYLAADSTQIEGIIRAYLMGGGLDLVEEQEFRIDAYSWRARLDFGVGVIDYRGLFMNAGA